MRPAALSSAVREKTRSVCLKILGADGKPSTDQTITVSQRSHHFLFGCNGFFTVPLANGELDGEAKERAERSRDHFVELLNYVTLPFYWGRFERTRGQPDTDRIMAAAKWFVSKGLQTKGHPLAWHTAAPDWLLPLSNTEILAALKDRIRRDVTGFAGVVDTWDAINEVVIMPVYDRYDNGLTRICREMGRVRTIRTVFDEARAANPGATLLLNDFDVSSAYDILVDACLQAGIRIDAIGIQSHMHQGYWGVGKTQRVLEHFERFKLPIHLTECSLVSGSLMPPEIDDLNDHKPADWPTKPQDEERQAREAVEFYRTLFAHPLVTGITWWDFLDGQWLGAPSGLLRKDGSPKPIYDELLGLVKKEWWMQPTTLRTDSTGLLRLSGYLGEYVAEHQGRTATFSLAREGPDPIEVRLPR